MHPGCGQLVNGKYSKCETHLKAQRKRENEQRSNATHSLYGRQWQKARAVWLRANPICIGVQCIADGQLTPATVVDHIKPHKGDPAAFWDRDNWQSLCKPCHDSKTARFDGGFGRAYRESE
jgi:5-methylcytosine-specific restriction protein A